MTISVNPLPLFEKGKTYPMYVQYVAPKGTYVNVQHKDSGKWFTVEVPTAPLRGLAALKDTTKDFVCTEVTEKGPEFALAERYFAPAHGIPRGGRRGANVGCVEGKKVEFKRSLVYSPYSHQPDSDQPFEIAKEIAAFMNTEGGDLFMGVDDEGFVRGIENDYPVLGQAAIMMNDETDAKWEYSATADAYKRKLTTAVQMYLGVPAASSLMDIEEKVDDVAGLTYLIVHVKPSDEVIYLGRDESVVCRTGASVSFLKGRQREQYVKHRFFLRGEKSNAEALAAFKKEHETLKKELEKAQRVLVDAVSRGDEKGLEKVVSVTGTKYKVAKDTCLPLDEKFLRPVDRPSGLVYKAGEVGQRLMPCSPKMWKALYEQLLKLCADLDPEKFAALPDNPDFEPKRHCARTKPNFIRRSSRIRLPSASVYLGKDSDIRANLQCASKAAFLSPTSLPRRLMDHFGIAVTDIRIWNEE